jgi:hypothetical protein
LIKGSLTDSSFHLLANSIPFTFHDIESFAEILFTDQQQTDRGGFKLFQGRRPGKNTTVRILSINYIPEPNGIPGEARHGNKRNLFVAVLVAFTMAILISIRKRTKKIANDGNKSMHSRT